MKIPFWKLSGAGNDFVLLAAAPKGERGSVLARRLCARRRGIGADGLLILSRRGGRLRLDYWNADGSPAFCGNGARCAAMWAKAKSWVKGSDIRIETSRGTLNVRMTLKGRAEVSMPAPKGLRLGLRLRALARVRIVHFVDTGVPHAVIFVPNIEAADVDGLGRALRSHKAFGKSGANVDFVQIQNKTLLLRTYERGVEDETPACGTGVVAAAFVARVLGRGACPQRVKVRSGDIMSVSFDKAIRLEGPGEIVFTGEVDA